MHIGRVGSVLLTLSVTVERFFAIVHPLKRIKRTRFLIYSSVMASVAYNIPRFFEFKTGYCLNNDEECIKPWSDWAEAAKNISQHSSNGSTTVEVWVVS